jgi:molybdenum cofactor cytidylyltransferase
MRSETSPEPSGRGGPVAGILLAAGTSSRMGSNKLLFHLDGETVLHGAARRALDAGLAPLVVVLGHEAERTRRELAELPCQVVVNPDYEQGISYSLHAGLEALQRNADRKGEAGNRRHLAEMDTDAHGAGEATPAAVVVMLADMPAVSTAMLAALVDRYRTTKARLVISDYAGVNAPPMLYDRSLFAELRETGGGCGKQVVRRHRQEAEVMAWPAAALADLDVPEDYARLRAGAGGA